jgi:hypothetical protein
MEKYDIKIKLIDDSLEGTKFSGLELESAWELMEGIWQGTAPRETWAGLAVVSQRDGTIESELEW